MNIAFLCVLIMGLMPILLVGLAKFSVKGYNNRAPREFLAKLHGWQQRASWAHSNSFEALPLFIAGVMVAVHNNAPQHKLDLIAVAVVVLRLIYSMLYIMDKAALRSLVWFAALACTVSMFFI